MNCIVSTAALRNGSRKVSDLAFMYSKTNNPLIIRCLVSLQSPSRQTLNAYNTHRTDSNATENFSIEGSPSKVVPNAKEALSDCIHPGMSINVGGFGLGGKPETLLNELAEDDRAKDLTIASLTAGVDGFGLGKLFDAGKVKRMIASYVGENQVRSNSDCYEYVSCLSSHISN